MIRLWRVGIILVLLVGLLPSPSAADITSNLILLLNLNEGTGNPADTSGAGHTVTRGAPSADPTWQTTNCHVSNCLSFDGGDTLTVADAADLSFNTAGQDQPLSVTLWANITNIATFQTLLAKYNLTVGRAEYRLIVSASELYFFCVNPDSSAEIARSFTLTSGTHQGQWIHIAATYSGNESSTGIKLYINGSRVDDADANSGTYTGMTPGAEPVTIGYLDVNAAAALYTGRVDDIKMFARELSAADVLEDFSGVASSARRRPIVY